MKCPLRFCVCKVFLGLPGPHLMLHNDTDAHSLFERDWLRQRGSIYSPTAIKQGANEKETFSQVQVNNNDNGRDTEKHLNAFPSSRWHHFTARHAFNPWQSTWGLQEPRSLTAFSNPILVTESKFNLASWWSSENRVKLHPDEIISDPINDAQTLTHTIPEVWEDRYRQNGIFLVFPSQGLAWRCKKCCPESAEQQAVTVRFYQEYPDLSCPMPCAKPTHHRVGLAVCKLRRKTS